jgi:hypothetical protein
MDTEHDSKFTGPTTSVRNVNTEVKDIQYPCMINKRKFNTEMSGHSYSEVTMGQEAKVSTDLVGPRYEVAAVHAFKGIMTHAHRLTEMVGPVLGNTELEVDCRHHYSELGKHAETLKSLSVPIYNVEKNHNFDVIMKEAEKLVSIMGPVYPVEHGSNFQPEAPKANQLPLMTGPKLTGVQDSNKYCPVTARVPGDAPMVGPVYPGVEARNKYRAEAESAPTEVLTQMNAPVYSSVAGGSMYSFEAPVVPGVEVRQFGPTRAGAASESHEYGPVPAKVAGVPLVTGPVRLERGENKFCPVAARVAGQLATVGPVYAGVDSNNSYSETPGRVSSVPLMAGPVFPGVESRSGFTEVPRPRADLAPLVSAPCYPADSAHSFSGKGHE